MALNLGQVLGGAGVVASRQRQAEEAERTARLNQLDVEERNRQELLRREMTQAPMPTFAPGSLEFPEALGVRPIGQAPAAAAPAAPQPPAPAAPAAAPAVDQFESLYERVKTMRRTGPMGRLGYNKELDALIDKRAFSDEDVARIYAIALNKQDDTTANTLRDILVRRGVPPADVNQIGYTTRRGLRALAGVKKEEEAAAAAADERRRLFELKTGRKVGTATRGEVLTPGAPAAAEFDRLAAAVKQVESGGDPNAVSPKGALGTMQTMPGTLVDPGFGVAPARDRSPQELERVGKDYLAAMLREFRGNLDHALAAYNWGPGNAKQWVSRGANVAELPAETQNYIQKVKSLLGGAVEALIPTAEAAPAAGVATVAAPQVQTSDVYLANPQAVSRDMQVALQQRQELAQLAGMYQRAGMGAEFMQTRAKVMELDNNMLYLQGMQGIQEFYLANDPRRLSAVWSQYSGIPVNVQPRSDGKFDILVGGRRMREGLSDSDITSMARLSFDTAYRQTQAQAGAEINMEVFKSMLKIAENQAQGNINQALEWAKANYGWDIKPTGAGDGTIIIRPPGQAPYLYNPSGRTVEVDGVKITTNSAYPIAGLPSLRGTQPR